jgi:predicted ABC-type transport system involved in lysophospholipase L1 biosynthesis ATPase subunit
MNPAVLIEAQGASLIYRDGEREVRAVDAVSLQVRPSEFVGIVGPSGSGKSSLLYLLSGLKLPTHGAVRYRGRCYTEASDAERSAMRRERFGFVFQQPYLLGYLTVLENVVVGAPDVRAYRERALGLLEQLGLADKAHRYPSCAVGWRASTGVRGARPTDGTGGHLRRRADRRARSSHRAACAGSCWSSIEAAARSCWLRTIL